MSSYALVFSSYFVPCLISDSNLHVGDVSFKCPVLKHYGLPYRHILSATPLDIVRNGIKAPALAPLDGTHVPLG